MRLCYCTHHAECRVLIQIKHGQFQIGQVLAAANGLNQFVRIFYWPTDPD